MSYVHIAHDCIIGNNVIMGSYAGLAGEVDVFDFAIISPGTLVHQFVRVGGFLIIQGGSKVSKDVPPYITAGRDPLSYMGINMIGLRRKGYSAEKINEIHEIYRYIYQKGMNVSQALERIEADFGSSPERDMILNFIRGSKRGIIRGGMEMDPDATL